MRRILWLLRDATAKVLVFSTWVDVIDLMAHALGTNGVRFAYPRSQAKFSRELAAFRSSAAATQQPGAPGLDPRWDRRLRPAAAHFILQILAVTGTVIVAQVADQALLADTESCLAVAQGG